MIDSWYKLADHFCARRASLGHKKNDYFEQFSIRRYNYAQTGDTKSVRLIFLGATADNPVNKTLVRNGRFIWCKNLAYEGTNEEGFRQISFTIGKGKKRFIVPENLILCLPSSIYVNNNGFMRHYDKIFSSFSSVFRYEKALRLMLRTSDYSDLEEFVNQVETDSPYKTGTLVKPRLGYFMPNREKLTKKMHDLILEYCRQNFCLDKFQDLLRVLTHYQGSIVPTDDKELVDSFFEWCETYSLSDHPYGIILGKYRETSNYAGRELYRVSFGGTIYEKVHPVQLEVVSEI
jgi:hypothetical protein